jgi:FKBP-type peptidyl-prolyl cis-trans isomerase FkpA
MRKLPVLVVLAIIMCLPILGCLKSSTPTTCTNRPVDQDEATILAYLAANSVTGYVKHASGMYYKIDSLGSGPTANASSKVYVQYSGKFTNNTVFDSESDATKTGFVLGTLIQAWQIGIPLIHKGGIIHLYVPSALAYGCQPTGPIPANAVLVFDIVLVDIA